MTRQSQRSHNAFLLAPGKGARLFCTNYIGPSLPPPTSVQYVYIKISFIKDIAGLRLVSQLKPFYV